MSARDDRKHLPTCPAAANAAVKCTKGKWCPGFEPAVIDGRLMRCSPSQVKTWKLCQLKWANDKVHDWERKPDGKGVITGKEGHGQIEVWAKTGQDIRSDLARLSDPYLKPFYRQLPFEIRKNPAAYGEEILAFLLSPNGDRNEFQAITERLVKSYGAIIEEPIPKLFTPGGVEMVGFADMIFRPGHELQLTAFDKSNVKHAIPDGGVFDCRHLPCVVDHKFRANVDKYAETATELEMDEQGIIYGRACLELWPEAQQIVFRHHNHQTKGRKFADAVTCVLGSDHIRLQWKAICDLIDGPMQAAAASGGLTAAFNEGSCNAYGGCDFEARCPNSPGNRLLAFIRPSGAPAKATHTEGSKPMATLAERLKAAQGGAPAASPAPVANTTPAPAQQQTATTPAPVQQQTQPAPAQGAEFIQARQCTEQRLYMVMFTDGPGVFQCAGVLPTGAFFQSASKSPKMAPLDTTCRDVTDDATARANFGLPALQAAAQLTNTNPTARMPITENGVQVSGVPLPGVPQSGPASITPPDMPAHSPAPNTPASTEPEQQTGKGKRGKAKKNEAIDAELILLVNCGSNGAQDLAGFVFEIAAKLAAKYNLADVRLAPADHALAFGRWKPILAGAALAECPKGLVSIRSGELADPIIEALAGVADHVVR